MIGLLHDVRTRYAPSYSGGLTNHLPMCVTALHKLGASEDRLLAFTAAYAPRLEPSTPWARAHDFIHEVETRGPDAVLREHLKGLLPGLAGAAFHGIIRVAYATMAKDHGELGTALAYLEDSALALDVPSAGTCSDVAVLADRLRDIDKPSGYTITERVLGVAKDPRFLRVAADLAVDKTTLSQVSSLGARWYLAADDFSSLHVLTGAHAVRVLRPWIDDERAADRALAIAALASFVVCGAPGRADARGLARADDKELKARALASDDDHVAKLVVSALDEELAEEDQIFRIVATRAARRGNA